MSTFTKLPAQQLSFTKKGKEWRKLHLDWAENKTFYNENYVRSSLYRKRINYGLVRGKLDMQDLSLILNPDQVDASYVPEQIQHYPIMNSKLNVLRGEELKRKFNFRAIVTNPNAISEIENNKKEALLGKLQSIIEDQGMDEETTVKAVEDLRYHFNYEWQDLREIRANYLINHYMKELSFHIKFNEGFMDALTVAEEIYQSDIVGGEPTFDKLNPEKVYPIMNGYSNKIEDADVIILIDYWSPGKITDTFYDTLTPKEVKAIEEMANRGAGVDSMDNFDETTTFFEMRGEDLGNAVVNNYDLFGQSFNNIGTNYFDNYGNIRVLRVYWKSRRKIKKVKSYDMETGEPVYTYHSESYILNTDLGEEEEIFWINEAWEGTKIGKDVYVNMRPRLVQYNRLSSPSRCHFGIVGSVYNVNEGRPYSLVDVMKPFAYLYDVIHERLNKAIAANWGKLLKLDLALIPTDWEIDKWMHYAKIHKIAVTDSFKEGNKGSATGKLAGLMNNQSSGTIDAETGTYIQQHIYLLEAIKQEMSECAGISKQREGQISNRETVGGIERATLQSSHITEIYFAIHDDVKKRALECFIETAKIAMRGGSKKFQYILPDSSSQIIEIDGDEFADADYGIVIDGSPESERIAETLQQLAQAALQNQTLNFSTIMKVITSPSMAEIQRTIERGERDIAEQAQEQAAANQQAVEAELAANMQLKQEEFAIKLAEIESRDLMNQRDNEVKLLIAGMNATEEDGIKESSLKKEELYEKIRQFDQDLAFKKAKQKEDAEIKKAAIKNKPKSTK
jgi:hypothetical protein